MLLTPVRKWRLIGGLVQIVFQTILISSGNLRSVYCIVGVCLHS